MKRPLDYQWVRENGPESERTLLLAAGAAFLGVLAFLGEAWGAAPDLRPRVVDNLIWFISAMGTSVTASILRLIFGELLGKTWFRALYLVLLLSSAIALMSGGVGLIRALSDVA